MSTNHTAPSGAAPEVIDASCRLPLLSLFVGAATWLVLGSVFGLIASIKFHSPDFLAAPAWLTYGRVKAVASHSLIYGFAVPAALGVGHWLMARLSRVLLAAPVVVAWGALLWNLALVAGTVGILAGDATGFEHLEFPFYAGVLMFLAYIAIGVPAVLTLHRRAERTLFVTQWFLLAALFWFPWIFSTANLLLLAMPVRGIAQAVVAWWFSANLLLVWFGLVGLGTAFYFLPRLLNRDLSSHYLALFVFWALILFGSWTGIPVTAPVPAWMPVLSTVATVLMSLCVLGLALVLHHTLGAKYSLLWSGDSTRFISFGLIAFLLAVSMSIAEVTAGVTRALHLTWFGIAKFQLGAYGFFAMILFGAIYFILPRLLGLAVPWPKLVRLHFWLSALGLVLLVLPLAGAGLLQSGKLLNPAVAFVDVSKATLHFLRLATIGELLILIGNLFLLLNTLFHIVRYARARLQAGFSAVSVPFPTVGVKS